MLLKYKHLKRNAYDSLIVDNNINCINHRLQVINNNIIEQ